MRKALAGDLGPDVQDAAALRGRDRAAGEAGPEHALEAHRLVEADLAAGEQRRDPGRGAGAAGAAVERARRADDGLLEVARGGVPEVKSVW